MTRREVFPGCIDTNNGHPEQHFIYGKQHTENGIKSRDESDAENMDKE